MQTAVARGSEGEEEEGQNGGNGERDVNSVWEELDGYSGLRKWEIRLEEDAV